MQRFFFSLLMFALGFVLLKYTRIFIQWFGEISWAEETFGGAGTHTFYKLAGLFFVIISLLYLFGALDLILSPLGGVFGGQ